jgi:NADPH:quinone reductase-like Zn-dependent oxidoreductase
LRDHGIIPVTYGDGQAQRLRDAAGDRLDAFIDTFGGGYVDLAIELGVRPDRINTIADFEAVSRLGVHGDGTHSHTSPAVLGELAQLAADGELEIPIAATFALEEVREAFTLLADRHTRGKIVLLP